MRVKDFEKAIEALGVDIVRDEVFLNHNQVKRFYGHRQHLISMWDRLGRGWSYRTSITLSDKEPSTMHRNVDKRVFTREPAYDLKFESSTEGM